MKKMTLILTVILTLTFLIQTESAEETTEIEKRIKQATDVLTGSSASREEITTALLQLIDLSIEIFPPSKYSDEIHSEIKVAKSQFKNTSFLDPKGRQYLLMTYRMMTEGKKYQTPEELDDFISPSEAMEKAQEYAKKLIDESLLSYRSGDKTKAAILLLELVIMIVTPVSA